MLISRSRALASASIVILATSTITAAGAAGRPDPGLRPVGPIGTSESPVGQSYILQNGVDPMFTQRDRFVTQPCQPIATLTQAGTGATCENWHDAPGWYEPDGRTYNYLSRDLHAGQCSAGLSGFWRPRTSETLYLLDGTTLGTVGSVTPAADGYQVTLANCAGAPLAAGTVILHAQPDETRKASGPIGINSREVGFEGGALGNVPIGSVVIDTDANGRGAILGTIAQEYSDRVVLGFDCAYPVGAGDLLVFQGTDGKYFQSVAVRDVSTGDAGPSVIDLAAAPPAGQYFGAGGEETNGHAFAVDLDAVDVNGSPSFGLRGAGIGQIARIEANRLTLHFPLEFRVRRGDRIAIMNGNGPHNGGTANEINIINRPVSSNTVDRGARAVCSGASLNCTVWTMDYIAQSERGAFNATTIIGELQNNNHCCDNDFNYGLGMFNNGEFRNGPAYQVGRGINAGAGKSGGGWEYAFTSQDGDQIRIADFHAGDSGAAAALLSTGSPNAVIEGNGVPKVAFLDYSPAGEHYRTRFRVSPDGGVQSAAAMRPGLYTVRSLPSTCDAGQLVYVSDARKPGEETGEGSGAAAICTPPSPGQPPGWRALVTFPISR